MNAFTFKTTEENEKASEHRRTNHISFFFGCIILDISYDLDNILELIDV